MQDLDGSGLPHEAGDRAARVSEREQAQRQHLLAEEPMYCDEPDIYAAYLKGALDLIDSSTLFRGGVEEAESRWGAGTSPLVSGRFGGPSVPCLSLCVR